MLVKISNKDGRYSVIDSRVNEKNYTDGIIKSVSSTEEQPFLAVNFDKEGKAVGGRTMTKAAIENLIIKAKEAGMIIEGSISEIRI